jgi:ADP-ribosylglycohydrolase
MPGWSTAREYAELELVQCRQEGRRVEDLVIRFEHPLADAPWWEALTDELAARPIDPGFGFFEPNGWEEIQAETSPTPTLGPLPTEAVLSDKFGGAWLGRSIGCALGLPIEGDPFAGGGGGRPGWKNIELWFRGADAWPIRGYVPAQSRAQAEFGLALKPDRLSATREQLKFMVSDDDIRYTVLGLLLLERHGADFDSWDVGKFWHEHLPYALVCTAETQAYLNFAQVTNHLHGAKPLDWRTRLDKVRTHRNPYREWIGAQIRVDAYAYAAAGRPDVAAEWAWRDASFSHVKNGVYGAMFCAAMIAAAFVESDPMKLVEVGLARIPRNCRLAAEVRQAVALALKAPTALDLVESLERALGHYHWIHTNNNAALVAAALVFGRGDFETTVTTAVLGGWDTDCNGATAGSIVGALVGASGIPSRWSAPLNDTLYAQMPGFHPIAISECGRRSHALFNRLL